MLMTPLEASAYLKVAVATLADWRVNQTGPAYIKLDGLRGSVRYRQDDLDAWIEARIVRHDAPAERQAVRAHVPRVTGQLGGHRTRAEKG